MYIKSVTYIICIVFILEMNDKGYNCVLFALTCRGQ